MFNIGFLELIIIFVVILIFIRPRDIPKFFRTLGRIYGGLKKYYEEMKKMEHHVITELEEEIQSVPHKKKNDETI
ncbi:MAG: hypothetical protein N2Z76_06260 [Treponemataceae bacterium]|nr:hypothetical protein [Treponemataceae bacterium]